MTLEIVPVTFAQAKAFVAEHHRHHPPCAFMRICAGIVDGDHLVGVAIAGNPKARNLQDGRTLEVTRSCTDGTRNANSMLYGAIWRAAKALGYRRCVTYTQEGESGDSLRAVGWVPVAHIPPSKGWDRPSRPRADHGVDGIARTRWEISR